MLNKQEQTLKLKIVRSGFNRRASFFAVRETFADCFPRDEFGDYRDFVDSPGECLKAEPRTRMTLLCRHVNGPGDGMSQNFVLKTYHYPFFPRIRTGFRIPKAEREFNALLKLFRMGVPVVEPVAFGVEKTLFGLVRSCFLLTVYVGETSNLWSHRKCDKRSRSEIGVQYGDVILHQIGEKLRRTHQARFFLFTADAKNILLRRSAGQSVETLFVDLPYARTLRWLPLARWAQKRDIVRFLENFLPYATDAQQAPFYEAYLPDPLGGSDRALLYRVGKAIKAKQNRTLITSWVNRVKRILRNRAKQRETNQSTATE